MATAKKKAKIQASEIEVGSRTLENVLLDLAEQVKANDTRFAHRTAETAERLARDEERLARVEERSTRAEELATIALQTIAAVTQDLRAITEELRTANRKTETRLTTLEKAAGF